MKEHAGCVSSAGVTLIYKLGRVARGPWRKQWSSTGEGLDLGFSGLTWEPSLSSHFSLHSLLNWKPLLH